MIHAWTNGAGTDFLYDYNGERTLKRGVHGETWYADKYWQVQNGHEVAKQVFVGDTRVVTRLEHDEWGDWEFEQHNVFYYHPDHLGSTTYVTKGDGGEWEHMEYTPYGEQWIDEGADRSVIGYRFTSKEYDTETGLYNFGQRYLDPTTSRWMSADPAMGKYLPDAPVSDAAKARNGDLPGMGGVFNLFNLVAYDYASNNPVMYRDPGGQQVAPSIPLNPEMPFFDTRMFPGTQKGPNDPYQPIPPGALKQEASELAQIWSAWTKDPKQAFANANKALVNRIKDALGIYHFPESRTASPGYSTASGETVPPGYDPNTWKKAPASRPSEAAKGVENLYDPQGKEWHYHPEDPRRNPHWDVKGPNKNDPWVQVPIDNKPPLKPPQE